MSRSLRLIPPLPPGTRGDRGLIGPDSMVWEIARYKAVLLGGPAALLLQVAHPLVAAGVAHHSSFQDDPLKRLIGTLEATLVSTFGDSTQAKAMGQRVRELHRPVHGVLELASGQWEAGKYYSAFAPELCLWVYATLIEKALDAVHASVRWVSFDERARYYQGSAPFGELFGVTAQVRPPTYPDFLDYYRGMLNNLVVDERAREIAQAIFAAKLYGVPVRPLGPVVAAGLLEPPIREAYGLSWRRAPQATWRAGCVLMRATNKVAPPQLKYWQHYRQAMTRVMLQNAPTRSPA